MNYALLFLFLVGLAPSSHAQHPALLPLPRQLAWHQTAFALRGPVTIWQRDATSQSVADSVAQFIRQAGRVSVRFAAKEAGYVSGQRIELWLEPAGPFREKPEGYSLTVTARAIVLKAATVQGLFWGYRTLQQLHQTTPRPTLADCTITDYPAFSVRGFMHDVGRSFISLDRLKQQIATLSRYKINTFHWHLTEDIAWRLQSNSLPNLTHPAFMTRFPGQFYTKQQARELVAFCKAHHVLLIPEIDMPGHSAAFRRATGNDMQSAAGAEQVEKLLQEVCALFDVPYIHLGTDEVAFRDSTFVPRMAAIVRRSGKQVIGWLPGARLDPSVIRQMWMGTVRPGPGQRVIDSRDLYFNHYSTQADLISLFQRDLCDTTSGSSKRLGAIGCIWNDRKLTDETQIERLNGFYPLMLTLAERTWRGGGVPETKAGVVLTDRPAFSEFETRLLAHKTRHFTQLDFPYVRQHHLTWCVLQPFPNNGDLAARFPPEDGKLAYPGVTATGATIYLRHTWGPELVRAYLDAPRPNHTAYAYTYVYSPRAQVVGAWIDFHNYGRSERDASPPAGQWDHKHSQLWVNDRAVQPPAWVRPDAHPTSHEEPYTNEPYELRPPVPVQLRRGWNKVLVKLPVGAFKTTHYRLVKWLFTCVFVRQQDGQYEVAGELVFAPDRQFPISLIR